MSMRFLDQRWPWWVGAGAIALLFLSQVVEFQSPGSLGKPGDWDPRPVGSVDDIAALSERDDVNLLFILIDTLRAEHLGSYGYARDTSPQLDQLASKGVRFARNLSQSSWTKASMASLWTGLYPVRTGVTRFDHVLPEEALMPAEILREAGFQTVGLYRNGWVAPTFGFEQGFEVYQRPMRAPLPPNVKRENPTLATMGSDEGTVAAALEFLRVRGDERWFLYLHLMDLHEYLYDEESALFGLEYSDVYDNSIRWTDGVVQELVSRLADLGYLENTIIVVASDHGEAFGERGFEGHARKVYRETTEVPLIVSFPFQLEDGVVVETRSANIDVWPTLLDLLGLDFPGTDGRSRLPEILASVRGEPLPESPVPAIAHLDQGWAHPEKTTGSTVAVSEGSLRYVRVEQPSGDIEQLFDASNDARELRDLARQDPETIARLGKLADEYLEQQPDWGEAPTREISELELNHLRALGYAVP